MKTRHGQSDCLLPDSSRRAFTLVEMLVSTGLVMLIMLMFTQIYSTAIGTMTGQRALANNDQKARILSTVLRSDLQNMSYRQPAFPYGNVQGIVPMIAGDEPIIDPQNQRGYFYYSENDPSSDTDDVLQFTTLIKSGQRGDAATNKNKRAYTGKALNGTASLVNQPDYDDGINDNQGQSRAAEISYFLRSGNLYRRVLLLRDPIPNDPPLDPQPTTNPAPVNRVYSGSGTTDYAGTLSFYGDFDYAATRQFDASGTYPWFHSIDSLNNNTGTLGCPIAYSPFRFGFGPRGGSTTTNVGLPIEFAGVDSFIGRPTIQETSSTNFSWPGQSGTGAPDIFSSFSLGTDGVLTSYSGSDRVGEDLLLTNVEAFDVKLHDPGVNDSGMTMGSYIDLGTPPASLTSSTTPLYSGAGTNYLNTNYHSAVGGYPNIYDTWHPSMAFGTSNYSPPFRPTLFSPILRGLITTPNTNQSIVIPSLNFDPTDATKTSNSLVYNAVSVPTTGAALAAIPPEFPPIPGTVVQDGNVTWKCVDNRIGLKGIHITVRYRDVSSNAPRQVTIDHSFVE